MNTLDLRIVNNNSAFTIDKLFTVAENPPLANTLKVGYMFVIIRKSEKDSKRMLLRLLIASLRQFVRAHFKAIRALTAVIPFKFTSSIIINA